MGEAGDIPPHMSDSTVRIAIIGAGKIGPRHAHYISLHPEAVLVALVDPGVHGVDTAAALNTNYYPTVESLLASTDKPDAVVICTPNHTHVPIAKKFADEGIHILIEKPLSADIESGKDLIEHLSRTQVKVLVGHHRRFNPFVIATKKAVETLGEVSLVSGLWTTLKAPQYFDPPAEWRQTKNGGPVLINLVHEVDILQYLFGPIISVTAEKAVSRRGYEVEEGGALTLRFESGVVGSLVFSDHVPSPFSFESGTGENVDFPHTGMDFYRIFGTTASLSVPDMTRWSYDRSGRKDWHGVLTKDTFPVQTQAPAFELQMDHFINVIRGKEVPRCTGQDALRALVVCEGIKTALETGTSVRIESV